MPVEEAFTAAEVEDDEVEFEIFAMWLTGRIRD